jgi:hypothetical protein
MVGGLDSPLERGAVREPPASRALTPPWLLIDQVMDVACSRGSSAEAYTHRKGYKNGTQSNTENKTL